MATGKGLSDNTKTVLSSGGEGAKRRQGSIAKPASSSGFNKRKVDNSYASAASTTVNYFISNPNFAP
jgi:hypothetical protein